MSSLIEPTIDRSNAEESDHLLLGRYSHNRTPEPFIELVRRHTGLVYGTCMRITANVHDAEELTQECFFDLARQASEIRTSLVGWLHQAATHRSLNRIRGDRRRQTHESEAGLARINDATTVNEPSVELSWSEIAPLVDQALAELPESLRTPILMRYLEGATQAEVANSLGVHQSTVSRRLSEGIESLRAALRNAGLVVPVTALVSWFAAQSSVAAPPALVPSICKIGLAGASTTIAAHSVGSGMATWLLGAAKGAFALTLVPLIAGVIWGDIVFLIAEIAWCVYLFSYQPEWYRILCFTRQFPNIYDWPFFPFVRWTWKSPPHEWRIWTAVYLITGIELVGLIALPVDLLKQRWLLILAASVWNLFMGIRIWRRVRYCRAMFPGVSTAAELPVDGALLLTYASAGVVLLCKLSVSPWFLSQPDDENEFFWLGIACVICWGTVLIWGTILIISRYRRWRKQSMLDPKLSKQISDLAPPRWLLSSLMLVPLWIAMVMTFATLLHGEFPIYVPWGDTAEAISRRSLFTMTLTAMDFIVLVILPLAYLYRRIPRIAWGVAFGLVGLIGTLQLGIFAKTIVAAPTIRVRPFYAPVPNRPISKGHFVVQNPPNLLENKSMELTSDYMGGIVSQCVRLASDATVVVEYDDHRTSHDVSIQSDGRVYEVNIHAFVMPNDFQNGVPSQIQMNLGIVDMNERSQHLEQFKLALPTDISPADWKAQIELNNPEIETQYPLGETITLGTVMGKPIMLKVSAR